jgi:hypothetical protein
MYSFNSKTPFLFLFLLVNVLNGCQAPTEHLGNQEKKIPMDSSFVFPAYMIQNTRLDEISGIAASRHFKDALWAHNDSGDKSRIFLLSTAGKLIRQFGFKQLKFRDVEDMAIGTGPKEGVNYLYLADMGDNQAVFDTKFIYRLPEPTRWQEEIPNFDKQVETISFQFPDGKRDAETLLHDPLTKDLYIVSKREKQVGVYRLAYPQSTQKINIAEKVAVLPFNNAVAGDISPDGREILIKNYNNIFYWKRKGNESIASALKRPMKRLPYLYEPQGEAICWSADASGYFTLSEIASNSQVNLYFFRRK